MALATFSARVGAFADFDDEPDELLPETPEDVDEPAFEEDSDAAFVADEPEEELEEDELDGAALPASAADAPSSPLPAGGATGNPDALSDALAE